MADNFDWRTDDVDWEEIPEAGERPSPKEHFIVRARRLLPWLGGAAVLLVVVGFVVVSLLNRQVEQAENTAAADVLAAHSLVRQANRTGDIDLFLTMVSDDSSLWQELQVDLLRIDFFLERQPLYMQIDYENHPNPGSEPVVTLSPDLQTAELFERIPYRVTNDNQQPETIWLEQVFVYQRQGESWLLSPLPEDDESFWGKWGTFEGSDYLTLIYPRRDEEVAVVLGSRLDDLIGRICSHELLSCPTSFHLELRFSREPSSLRRFNEDYRTLYLADNQSRYLLSLPTPTLIGRPLDEAGIAALYRGYANWLGAIIASQYFEGGTFIAGDPIAEIMADLGQSLPPEPVIPVPITAALPSPPIPFPDQDILVACSTYSSFKLLRYDLQTNQWSAEVNEEESSYLSSPLPNIVGAFTTPLPDGSGFLVGVADPNGDENKYRLVLWESGQEHLLLEGDRMYQLLPGLIQELLDPNGRNILLLDSFFYQQMDADDDFQMVPYVLNIDECLAGECAVEAYSGIPYWSPDSAWALLVDMESQSLLALRNEVTGEELPLNGGFSPYWTGEEGFIYIRPEDPSASWAGEVSAAEIVAADVTNPLEGEVLVDTADIAAVLTESGSAGPVFVYFMAAHPQQPDWIFIWAVIQPENGLPEDYLLAFDAESGDIQIVVESGIGDSFMPFKISADGRLLFVFSVGDNGSVIAVPLNPEEKTAGSQHEVYPVNDAFNLDWSRDGRWLLSNNPGGIQIIGLGESYDQTLRFEAEACNQAIWINK